MAGPGFLPATVRRRPILTGAALLLVLLIGLVIAARLWIASDGGRAYVLSRLNGQEAGRYGTLSAEGLSGDLLGRMHLQRLAVADAKGDWLVIRDVDLAWAPAALASGRISIDSLAASHVDILRKPELSEPKETDGGGKAPRINISSLSVPDLFFAEGVAGPEARFAVTGQFEQGDHAVRARLEATPQDGGGDHVKLDASRTGAGALHLDTEITGVPGGVLANLLSLPDGEGLSFAATASGDLENADGTASLVLGEQKAGTMEMKIHDRRLTATSDIDTTHLPLLGKLTGSLLGPDLNLRLESTTQMRDAPFGLEARFTNGSVSARGTADTKKLKLKDAADIDLRLSDVSALTGRKSALAFLGTAARADDGWQLAGNATLTGDGSDMLPFQQLSGPLKTTTGSRETTFSGTLTAVRPFEQRPEIARLLGESSDISVEGSVAHHGGKVDFKSVYVRMADGFVSARGTVDPDAGTLDLKGQGDTALSRLPGGLTGRVSGPISVYGPFKALRVDADLVSSRFGGVPDALHQLTGDAPGLRVALRIVDGGLAIDSARLSGSGATMTAAGRYAWTGNSDLRAALTQAHPVSFGDATLDLGSLNAQVTGSSRARKLTFESANGRAASGKRTLDGLQLAGQLSLADGAIIGPVSLRAASDGEPLAVDAQLERHDGETLLSAISGMLGPGHVTGDAKFTDAGGLDGHFSVDGANATWSGIDAKQLGGTLHLSREAGQKLAVEADLTAEAIRLSGGTAPLLDRVSATLRSAPDGYEIHAQLVSDKPQRATDLVFDSTANFAGDAPSGVFGISGTALGEPISTARPATWRLGDEPELDMQLALLSGTITANLTGAGDDTRLVFDTKDVDLAPALASFGEATKSTRLNGHGDLRVFGAAPSGTFRMTADSDVPGLDTSLSLDASGTLGENALTVRLQSNYGGKLDLHGDGSLPMIARAGHLVQPDRAAALTGNATLDGDLGVLRTIALAFGHDVGGTVHARGTLTGTLAAPAVTAQATVTDGVYEFGTTGFRLTGVSLQSAYEDRTLTVKASGKGSDGGTLDLDGRLAGENTSLTATLKDLTLYNRDGDYARGSGEVVLADSPDDRTLSGNLFLSQARFSIENLPSARPHALDVRWLDEPPAAPEVSRMRRTLGLNVRLRADRRIMITGRGLDSEWRLDVTATGTPAAPLLKGQANLVRGDLDLAGRPFVFDSGKVDFDGPPSRARIAVSAERSVDGFDAQVNVSGSPAKPVFELTSTPELPQDEILSRLLFNRSSMDLSPLEAAQLASSIAKLSGRSTAFDPVSGFEAALGIDRLSIGTSDAGNAQIGVGQYVSDDVYLQLKSAGAEGSSVEVEWQPKPQVSVTSETHSTGENKVSVRWKRDY